MTSQNVFLQMGYIFTLKIQNFSYLKMALRPFSIWFRLLTRNPFYAFSVITLFDKSRDLFYLIDSFR